MQVPAYVEYEKATSVEHALALLSRTTTTRVAERAGVSVGTL